MSLPWQPAWLSSAAPARCELWRGVEAQHRVATMRLADSLQEQQLLEELLETSKPPAPEAPGLHWLLFTPFRYASDWPSRFRRPYEPGAWYGAEDTRTVAAELGHWRWLFFMDSDGLRGGQLVTEHTFFLARFDGLALDLTEPPWARLRARWRDPDDYAGCQWLAQAARAVDPPVQAIRYESARLEGGLCQVVFEPTTLALPRTPRQQTWTCKVTRERVWWVHDEERIEFEMAGVKARTAAP